MQTFLKPLSEKEEAHYLALLKGEDREKAKDAKDKLIMHNLRLVAHIVKKYQNTPEEAEDYISIGIIGLMKAIDTFDAKRGRLATYACRCIDNAILSQMRIWFRTNPPRAEKHQNGVLWHRFPRISTSFAPLRRAM